MFYKGMPDLYEYNQDGKVFNVFWYEGEFYLHDRVWSVHSRVKLPDIPPSDDEFRYFDETDDVLKAMLEIAPYRDWKRVEQI